MPIAMENELEENRSLSNTVFPSPREKVKKGQEKVALEEDKKQEVIDLQDLAVEGQERRKGTGIGTEVRNQEDSREMTSKKVEREVLAVERMTIRRETDRPLEVLDLKSSLFVTTSTTEM